MESGRVPFGYFKFKNRRDGARLAKYCLELIFDVLVLNNCIYIFDAYDFESCKEYCLVKTLKVKAYVISEIGMNQVRYNKIIIQ